MQTARRQLSPASLAAASDARLVALTRAGDERAFAAIVDRYRAPLARHCRRFLSAAAADDALQQTFINAHASLTDADATLPLALKPWLYRIARNASLNLARDPQAALGPVPDDLLGRDDEPEDVFARREWLHTFVVGHRRAPRLAAPGDRPPRVRRRQPRGDRRRPRA